MVGNTYGYELKPYNFILSMNLYITTYKQGFKQFGSQIYANCFEEAESLSKSRNIGEVVEGKTNFENIECLINLKDLQDLTHYVCFLSFIALKSNRVSIDGVLGDLGTLHELIHFSKNQSDLSPKELANKIIELESLTSLVTHDFDVIHSILSACK